MMRVCHLDTCPVGIATQNPELRARFSGKPEFVETFFEYIAEEVREHLAALGFRSIEEAIGQVELPRHRPRRSATGRPSGLDLAPDPRRGATAPTARARTTRSRQDHGLEKALDHQLIAAARDALDARRRRCRSRFPIRNVNRTVGTMLGHEVTKRAPAGPGRRHHRRHAHRVGRPVASARSCPAGITLRLFGDANDYVGKGLSGGRVVVRPAPGSALVAEENVIAGNVIGYGATSGEIFLRGRVGERFCVRNSGATAVVEGVGDHGCEYMTGGTVARPRPHRAQLRGRHVRRRRPTCSTSTTRSVNRELVDLGAAAARATSVVVHDLLERHQRGDRLAGRGAAARRLGHRPVGASPWSCPATTSASSTCGRKAAAEGLDPDGAEVWDRIMEASRG